MISFYSIVNIATSSPGLLEICDSGLISAKPNKCNPGAFCCTFQVMCP